MVPIFKNKGNVQSCTNYGGIKFISHAREISKRVVSPRMKKCGYERWTFWLHASEQYNGWIICLENDKGKIQGRTRVTEKYAKGVMNIYEDYNNSKECSRNDRLL